MNNQQFLTASLVIIILAFFASPLKAQSAYYVPSSVPQVHYDLSVDINVEEDVINGSGRMILQNAGQYPLSQIVIDWPQTETSELELYQNGKKLSLINPGPSSQESRVYALNKDIAAGQKLEVQVDFKRMDFIGDDTEQIYLSGNWYPEIWRDGMPKTDSYSVKVNYPSAYQIAATGIEKNEKNRFEVDHARFFAVYLGKNQKMLSETVTGVQLRVLYPDDGEEVGQIAFDMSKRAMAFFVETYGFFPFPYYYVIPGSTRGPWGGYNFAPGMGVVHGMNHFKKKSENFWNWITVHELCHHYWGEYVLDGDQATWLWIGLGIYADETFLDHIEMDYPIYRNFHERYFYQGVQKYHNTTLAITAEFHEEMSQLYDWNNTSKHGKGYTVIKALESVIGKENMQVLSDQLLCKYAWKPLNTSDFQSEVEAIVGEKLDWFFNQWVRSNKYLEVALKDSSCVKQNDAYLCTLTIEYTGSLMMPVPVRVNFTDDTHVDLKTNRFNRIQQLTCTGSAPLKSVQIDPEQQLPLFPEKVQLSAAAVEKIVLALPYTDVGTKANKPYQMAVEIDSDRIRTWFHLGLRLYESGNMEKSFDSYKRAHDLALEQEDHNMMVVTKCWMGIIHDKCSRRDKALECYRAASKLNYQGTHRFSQFNLAINQAWIEERLEKPYR